MTQTRSLPECWQHPALLSLLPLLYVAWADGDLTPEEIAQIRTRSERLSHLDDECRAVVADWLSPDHPPTPQALHTLLAAIRNQAATIPEPHKLALVDLGLQLARAGDPDLAVHEREVEALKELVGDLALDAGDATQRILQFDHGPWPEVESPPVFDGLAERLQQPFASTRFRLLQWMGERGRQTPPDHDHEQYRSWVTQQVGDLGQSGFGALSFPAPLGGSDSPGAFVAAFETLAFGNLSVLVKFGVQYGLFAGALHQLGNDAQHAKYLSPASTMSLPGCFAMTETGHGSNVQGLQTTATYDGHCDQFVIDTPHPDARKDYIGNAARDGEMAVVFARLRCDNEDYGVHAFLARIRDPDGSTADGVTIDDCGAKLGLNGVDNGRISFDRVRIPRDQQLDRFGGVSPNGKYESAIASDNKRFFTTLGALVGGRVSVALASLSVAKTALTVAIRYGEERRQFGAEGERETRLLDYPSHQLRLMPRLARTYAFHFALRQLAEDFVAAPVDDRRQLETDAAGLKALATWHATDVVQETRECCGGLGYLQSSRFADLKADCDVFTTFEGDNTVLLQLVAKSLLTGYRKQFADLNAVGVARLLIAQAADRVVELNPIATHDSSPDHLRDPAFQADVLRYRKDHLLSTLANRLRRRIKNGETAHEAFLACQAHLLATARAHVEHQVFTRMIESSEIDVDPTAKTALDRTLALAGVSLLTENRAWFQEHGVFGSGKAKAIQRLNETLCGELRPHAAALVAAFAIPDTLLPEFAHT